MSSFSPLKAVTEARDTQRRMMIAEAAGDHTMGDAELYLFLSTAYPTRLGQSS